MSSKPELSRRIQVRSLGVGYLEGAGLETSIEATPPECVALASRLGLPAVAAVSCRFRLSGVDKAGVVIAEGLLHARLVRTCVTTLDDFPTALAEQFSVRFVPAERVSEVADADLDLEEDDDIPYAGGTIDLGEAAVEQLALSLDPYPRKPGAERPAGVAVGDPPSGPEPAGLVDPENADTDADADHPNPFAALARLRRIDG